MKMFFWGGLGGGGAQKFWVLGSARGALKNR